MFNSERCLHRKQKTSFSNHTRRQCYKKLPHLKLDLGHVTDKNIKQVQILNHATFPVHYRDRFYEEMLKDLTFTRLGFYADVLACAICCRIDPRQDVPQDDKRTKRLYILTLSVLPAYRRRGFGKQLLDFVYTTIQDQAFRDEIFDVYLHVHTANIAALEFYKSCGFEQKEEIKDYYKNLDPPDCFMLSKEL
eukprot:GEMP01021010.1.p1 GENE.GEMP01021010.1~~GEMP01021010.1.p1  ORF type:complete len:192 (+),score=20.48 GEMP01021010.1:205-780(+)